MTSIRVRVRTTPGLLKIEPRELQFPSISSKPNSVSMQLSNRSENYVDFKVNVVSTNQNEYLGLPDAGIMEPHSTVNVLVTMLPRKDAPPDLEHKDIILVTCVVVNKGTSAKDIPANLVNKGLEEGSTPKDSVPDNGTVNPSKYKTVGESLLEALRYQPRSSTRPNLDRQESSSQVNKTEGHNVGESSSLEAGCYDAQPQSPVQEELEGGSSPGDSVPDNGTVNPSKNKTVGESLLEALRYQPRSSTRPNFDRQESSSQDTFRRRSNATRGGSKSKSASQSHHPFRHYTGIRGRVAGSLVYKLGERTIDCRTVGIEGQEINYDLEDMEIIQWDAKIILLVEKESIFYRLVEDKVSDACKCIIVTTCGQPSTSTKHFLAKLQMDLKLPVVALIDCNVDGLKIITALSNMAFDSENLTTRSIYWLGVRPTEFNDLAHIIPKPFRIPTTTEQTKLIEGLMENEAIMSRPEWAKELAAFLKLGFTFNLEALKYVDIQYISKIYLPSKLGNEDWIRA